MYEKARRANRNQYTGERKATQKCNVLGCNRAAIIFIKEHNILRCATCYQRDIDKAGLSANQASAEAVADAMKR